MGNSTYFSKFYDASLQQRYNNSNSAANLAGSTSMASRVDNGHFDSNAPGSSLAASASELAHNNVDKPEEVIRMEDLDPDA